MKAGDDLVGLLLESVEERGIRLVDGDILVVAQKIVSKSEGREICLKNITPSAKARELSESVDKDPRIVEVILGESREVVRHRKGLVIVENKHGVVLANAGIDMSNVEQDDGGVVLLLPENPDRSAEAICDAIKKRTDVNIGLIINDSLGRAFRNGTTGVALGVAGLPALADLSGTLDLFGRPLQVTQVAVADELAAAASLLMGQAAEGQPAVLVRGFASESPDGNSSQLTRTKEDDLFRAGKS